MGKERLKSWQRKSATISSIAQTLFKVHGFDIDRAIAVAYWFKTSRMVTQSEFRFYESMRRSKILQDLAEDDARTMLRDYQAFQGLPYYEIDRIR